MEKSLGRYSSPIYAILRIVIGLLFFMHGTQKVLQWPPRPPDAKSVQAPPRTPPPGQSGAAPKAGPEGKEGGPAKAAPSPLMMKLGGVSGYFELVLGLLITIGLFGSLAAFIASGMMAVAYFGAHHHWTPLDMFWPLNNKGESAVIYCFVFLYMAAHGSGIWSIDAAIKRTRTPDSDSR